jgi:hypothetical protein
MHPLLPSSPNHSLTHTEPIYTHTTADKFFKSLWGACNLTALTHSSTGPVVHLFASHHEGPGFNPQGGYLCETGILPLALSCYIGDPDMIDHCVLVWGGLRSELSLGHCANNLISHSSSVPVSRLLQFLLPASQPHCRLGRGALLRASNLTTFTYSSTGPVVRPFASHCEGPGFNPQGGTYVKPGFSR